MQYCAYGIVYFFAFCKSFQLKYGTGYYADVISNGYYPYQFMRAHNNKNACDAYYYVYFVQYVRIVCAG